jgi:hypothetical protein
MLCLCAKNIKASEPKMFFFKEKTNFCERFRALLGANKVNLATYVYDLRPAFGVHGGITLQDEMSKKDEGCLLKTLSYTLAGFYLTTRMLQSGDDTTRPRRQGTKAEVNDLTKVLSKIFQCDHFSKFLNE